MSWITNSKDGIAINLKIAAGSKRNQVQGLLGDFLKVQIQAPPVDGKANKALINFLAQELGVSRADLTLLSGESGRIKRIAVTGVDATSASELLLSNR